MLKLFSNVIIGTIVIFVSVVHIIVAATPVAVVAVSFYDIHVASVTAAAVGGAADVIVIVVVVAGAAAVFAAATASFTTAALATAVSALGVTTVLWCFCWYYSSAV